MSRQYTIDRLSRNSFKPRLKRSTISRYCLALIFFGINGKLTHCQILYKCAHVLVRFDCIRTNETDETPFLLPHTHKHTPSLSAIFYIIFPTVYLYLYQTSQLTYIRLLFASCIHTNISLLEHFCKLIFLFVCFATQLFL